MDCPLDQRRRNRPPAIATLGCVCLLDIIGFILMANPVFGPFTGSEA